MKTNVAIIVAAGVGSRTGLDIPKQFTKLCGRTVLEWSVKAFSDHGAFKKVILVVSESYVQLAEEICSSYINVQIVLGGNERADSVRNALNALRSEEPDHVFIHDAARPGLTSSILDSLIEALKTYDGAAPALPVVDAIKNVDSSGTVSSVDRSQMMRIQTPQAFDYSKILKANAGINVEFVDDLEAAQALNMRLKLVQGVDSLMKFTHADDLNLLEKLMSDKDKSMLKFPRIGSGFDVHVFQDGDFVTLCGVKIPYSKKLKGHSDADVAWHALTDALYGALAKGDIGRHFPPTDPQWKGVASSVFLEHAAKLVKSENYIIANVDLTIICEAPKIGPHAEQMKMTTADMLGVGSDQVSIKATTTEKLGFTGRSEGIAAQASVQIIPT